jgi:Uma2 family endonuclease
MATDFVSESAVQALPVGLRPNVEHLVTEDNTPVDNVFSEKQQRLLTEPLYSSWGGPGEGRSFVAMANVGLFYAVHRPPYVPDVLLSLDVEVPADLWEKPHRSYFVWEYGKAPDVVVEVVSGSDGGEDTDKLAGYARVGIRYYAIFDPEKVLGEEPLRVYQLEAMRYRRLAEPAWLSDVGLGLRLWQGPYEQHDNTWLRWVDHNGQVVPSGSERADEQQRRAERLAEQLRRLGVTPEG